MKKKLIDRDDTSDTKFTAVDNSLKRLEQKLRNGTALEQGQRGANKVSAMAAHLTTLNQQPEEKLAAPKSVTIYLFTYFLLILMCYQNFFSKFRLIFIPFQGSTKVVICNQGASEICHFCFKRVYLMERLSAEGRFFHRGCFRCEYCGISLRLGKLILCNPIVKIFMLWCDIR